MNTKSRRSFLWHTAGAGIFVTFAILSWLSRHPTPNDVWIVLSCLFVSWLVLIALYLGNRPGSLSAVWVWAILLRVTGLVGQPLLEDDWYRYLWDGRLFALDGNPYGQAPIAFFNDPTVPPDFANILSLINYPDIPTIYGPVCQYLFLLSYWIDPGQLWPIKLGLIVADLITLRLLLHLVTPRQALLYAWCPLLIFEMGFNAHPESLGICFLVAAVWAKRRNHLNWVPVLLALAGGTRIFSLAMAPLLLVHRPLRLAATFGATLAALYSVFWFQGSAADLSVLFTFAAQWEFNSSLYAVFSSLVGRLGAAWLGWALFGGFYLWYLRRFMHRTAEIPRGDWIFGAFFLVSPVVNPWYLLWLVPFVAIFPSATGITALAVVSLSYLQGMNLGNETLGLHEHPAWLRPIEFGAIMLAGVCDWRRTRPNRPLI